MSNSRRREVIEVGVGVSAESVRRMFPSLLMNCRSKLGVNAGPSPIYCQFCSHYGHSNCTFGFWGKKEDVVEGSLSMQE